MKAQKVVVIALKVMALSVLMVFCLSVGGALSGISKLLPPSGQPAAATSPPQASPHFPRASVPAVPSTPAPSPAKVLPTVLLVCFLQTVVLTYIILRSRWTGWRLVGAVFLAMFGLATLQSAIEAALFLNYLTHRVAPGLGQSMLVMGAFTAGVFSPLAVLILGRMSARTADETPNTRLVMPLAGWVWKASVVAVVWVLLYHLFGYYVAWQSPAVREFYGGTDPGSFFKQLASTWSTAPWMFPFQALRGLLFLALVLPLIRMLRGRPWEAGLAVALVFSMLMGAPLLIPNPLMPEAVAKAHLMEVMSENFVFGWLVGWLFSYQHGFKRELPVQHSAAA